MQALEAMSDDELLRRAQTEREAFAVFYRRHVSTVAAYFARRTDSPDLAADLTAETFAAALEALDRYDPSRGRALAWLFGIARHKLQDSCRHQAAEDRARRHLQLQPIALEPSDRDWIAALAEPDAAPSLEQLVAALPPAQQRAIQQRFLLGLSYREMSEDSKAAQAAMRQRVSRGLAAIRAKWENP